MREDGTHEECFRICYAGTDRIALVGEGLALDQRFTIELIKEKAAEGNVVHQLVPRALKDNPGFYYKNTANRFIDLVQSEKIEVIPDAGS